MKITELAKDLRKEFEESGATFEDFRFDKMKELLESMSDKKIVRTYQNYLSEYEPENDIYANDEFFFQEMFKKADDAVRAVCYGNYRYNDDYVKFNGYGNLESMNEFEVAEEAIKDQCFIEWAVDNYKEIDDYEIQDVFEALNDYYYYIIGEEDE